jgi:diaminopimelate epimerase
MRFTKMQGLGNDYLYVYGEAPADVAPLCVKLSDRHLGAGADGMIFISPSASADFRMRIFNADGSEAAMCGNGIRCVGKYVYDKGYTDKTQLRIETNSGPRTLRLHVLGDRVRSVTVDMGTAEVGGEKELSVDGQTVRVTPVSVGNPHAVLFTKDAEAAPLTTLGPRIEHHPAFPGGVNVEFVEVLSRRALRMRVWERGSGITMACGTGACASAAASVSRGLCKFSEPVSVDLDGGTLKITIEPDMSTRMTGPAATVYEADVAM